jgi:signal transduction histidine kinase
MTRLLNSFQFRLYAILAGLSLLLLTFTFIGVRTSAEIDQRQDQMKSASDQRAAAYLLVSQARHFAHSRQEIILSNLGNAILDTIEEFDANQAALRFGDPAQSLPPLREPELIAILDQMDDEWGIYRAALQALLVGNRANFQEQVKILVDIDAQSTAVYTLADQLTDAFDNASEVQQRNFQDGLRLMAVVALAVVAAAIAYIIQMVRAFNSLTNVAAAFSDGNFEARANTSSLTEINQIGETLNEMAFQVGTLITTLEERTLIEIAARERAERSDQVKSAFLAAMSHELRTPLNAIINFTKFVVKGVMGPVNDRQVETLNKVADSGKHLLNLINDILDISKIESGSLNLFIEDDVNIGQLVTSAASTAESLLVGKPVSVICDVDPNLPLMWGDKQRILQILLNVVSNACKFTDEGYIRISAHQRGGEMHLAVEDTGPGIAVEDYATVFQAFKQTNTGLRQGSGTGLGMPISRSLAEAHGGRMWLKSEVGKGSTFFVVLPLKSESMELTLAS